MSRIARLALALFLVPVVVFSTPTTAAAAQAWTTVTVSHNEVAGDVNCRFSLRFLDEGDIVITGSTGYCKGGANVGTGLQAGEAGAGVQLTLNGLQSDGTGCGGVGIGTLGPHSDNNNWGSVAGTFPSLTIGVDSASSPDCTIQEVCLDHLVDQGGDNCVPATVSYVEPEPLGTACYFGTPSVGVPTVELVSVGSSTARYRLRVPVSFAAEAPPGRSWTAASYSKRSGNWIARATSINRFAGATTLLLPDEIAILKTDPAPPVSAWGDQGIEFSTPLTTADSGAAYDGWNSMGGGYDNFSMAFASNAGSGYAIPPGKSHYYGGWTDAAACRFWIGPKVIDVTGYTNDEPLSEVGQAPELPPQDPEPTTVAEPEPTPPDEPSFWAAILALLRSVWNAITGIARAVLDGLKALFIPDGDNWGVGELVDQLETKPPFSLLGELEDEARSMGEAYRSGGGCGVIADFGNGGVISCATIANVPGYSALYSLVSAGLMGLTGWSMFLMVSRLFEQGQ